MHNLTIEALPAFQDNYIWLLSHHNQACAVVDPGDAAPVIRAVQERGLIPTDILITHHHRDHIGGVKALLKQYPEIRIIAPHERRIPQAHLRVAEGERFTVLGVEFNVLEVPAHTRSHVAYYTPGRLFCGDTLFSVGCGRLFEGTAQQMQAAMDKFRELPGSTEVYCTHEYTASNCAFALRVDPNNPALQARAAEVTQLRQNQQITLPSTIAEETASNPFMRTREPELLTLARQYDPQVQPGADVLKIIRELKDAG